MSNLAKLRFVTFLTFARFPLVVLFFIGAILGTPERPQALVYASLAFLILAAITDLFDGYFARKFDVVTEFGAHADPLMDKFYYLATFPVLVFIATRNGHMSHAIFLLVITLCFLSRDQWVTFLRSIGSMYQVSGKAHWIGKLRTGINFPLICIIYYHETARDSLLGNGFVYTLEAGALAINFISVYTYTRIYWPYLRKSAGIANSSAEATK